MAAAATQSCNNSRCDLIVEEMDSLFESPGLSCLSLGCILGHRVAHIRPLWRSPRSAAVHHPPSAENNCRVKGNRDAQQSSSRQEEMLYMLDYGRSRVFLQMLLLSYPAVLSPPLKKRDYFPAPAAVTLCYGSTLQGQHNLCLPFVSLRKKEKQFSELDIVPGEHSLKHLAVLEFRGVKRK